MMVANPTLPDGVSLRPAGPGDLPAVRRLLALGALPLDGLEDAFGPAYVVAVRGDGEVVGVAGVEEHGAHGLLRSVAVSAVTQGHGLGRVLVQDRLARAKARGLTELHLLTTTAAGYFERLGFRRVDRDAVPPEIRASVEFARACPESAIAMSLSIDSPAFPEECRPPSAAVDA